MKLTTAKQAVLVASEVLEAFGGAGYVEDTGLPVLLRDSQVLPIWEGTTNVLALDALRVLRVGRNVVLEDVLERDDYVDVTSRMASINNTGRSRVETPLQVLRLEVTRWVESVGDPRLASAARVVVSTLDHAAEWVTKAEREGRPTLETGARRFALTLGRSVELALLIKQAQWSQIHESDGRATASARRFASIGIDLIIDNLE